MLTILDILISYYSLFSYFAAPILEGTSNFKLILIISFLGDLGLFIIGALLSGKKLFTSTVISKYSHLFQDHIILNIFFRFIPILSHLGNFLSGIYSKNNKIFGLLSLILGYFFVYVISATVGKILWGLYNPTYMTSGNDMSLYIGFITSLIGIFCFFIYLYAKRNKVFAILSVFLSIFFICFYIFLQLYSCKSISEKECIIKYYNSNFAFTSQITFSEDEEYKYSCYGDICKNRESLLHIAKGKSVDGKKVVEVFKSLFIK